MKKLIYTSLLLLSTASFLVACASKKTTKPTSHTSKTSQSSKLTSSTKTNPHTTSSDQSETTTTPSSRSDDTAPVQAGMDIQAIQKGDYSSIVGTWQNSNGNQLVFNQSGLVSTGMTMPRPPKENQGVLQGDVSYQSGNGGFILLFIPRNVVIPQSHFHEGKDSTDSSRDRLVGTQVALSEQSVQAVTFYKVSDSAE